MKVVPTLRTAEKPSIVSSFVLISISTASVKCKSVCVCVWLPQPLSLSLSLLIQQVTHSRCGLIPLCQFAYTYRDPNGSFPFIYFASWPLSLSLLSLLLNLTLLSFHTLQSLFIGHLSLLHSATTSLSNTNSRFSFRVSESINAVFLDTSTCFSYPSHRIGNKIASPRFFISFFSSVYFIPNPLGSWPFLHSPPFSFIKKIRQ